MEGTEMDAGRLAEAVKAMLQRGRALEGTEIILQHRRTERRSMGFNGAVPWRARRS